MERREGVLEVSEVKDGGGKFRIRGRRGGIVRDAVARKIDGGRGG
jgi:hypothetical protein